MKTVYVERSLPSKSDISRVRSKLPDAPEEALQAMIDFYEKNDRQVTKVLSEIKKFDKAWQKGPHNGDVREAEALIKSLVGFVTDTLHPILAMSEHLVNKM